MWSWQDFSGSVTDCEIVQTQQCGDFMILGDIDGFTVAWCWWWGGCGGGGGGGGGPNGGTGRRSGSDPSSASARGTSAGHLPSLGQNIERVILMDVTWVPTWIYGIGITAGKKIMMPQHVFQSVVKDALFFWLRQVQQGMVCHQVPYSFWLLDRLLVDCRQVCCLHGTQFLWC